MKITIPNELPAGPSKTILLWGDLITCRMHSIVFSWLRRIRAVFIHSLMMDIRDSSVYQSSRMQSHWRSFRAMLAFRSFSSRLSRLPRLYPGFLFFYDIEIGSICMVGVFLNGGAFYLLIVARVKSLCITWWLTLIYWLCSWSMAKDWLFIREALLESDLLLSLDML